MEGTAAFQPFQALAALQQTACACPAPFNVPVQLTLGLTSLHQAGKEGTSRLVQAPSLSSQTLSDGRLSVGTQMPLLAKRYRYLSVIGEGASAQVILAEDILRPGGQMVAIKIMKRQYSYGGQKEARALRYIQASSPECTRVVRLLGTFTHAGHTCLVLERLFPSLLDYLSDSATLSAPLRLANLRGIAYQLLGTVAVMHARGVVNADLKPENVLLKQPHTATPKACPEVVISDFGSAFSETETDTFRLVFEMQTLPYRAPEVVLGLGTPLGTALDVWSLGCMLAELALQQPLFPCHSPPQLLKQMEQLLGPLPPQLQRGCQRSAGQLPAGSPAPSCIPQQQATAQPGSTGQPALPWLGRSAGSGFNSANRRAALSFLSPLVPGQAWHEALNPLGKELVKVDRALADLVLGMLQLDAMRRLTAAAALLHPFFDAVSPMRALMQATLQPSAWNAQEDVREGQQQVQPPLAPSQEPAEPPAGPSAANEPVGQPPALEQAHQRVSGPPNGGAVVTPQQDIAEDNAERRHLPAKVGAEGAQNARQGSLGATGEPAASPEVSPRSAAAELQAVNGGAWELPASKSKTAGKDQQAKRAAGAGNINAQHEEQCSSGSQKAARAGAKEPSKVAFATLKPEVPRSLRGPAGYTDSFAFLDVGADATASAAQTSGVPKKNRGVQDAAGWTGAAPFRQAAGGKESQPSSLGTPDSSGGTGRAAYQPSAAAAARKESQLVDSGSAGHLPALSSASGVGLPAQAAAAAPAPAGAILALPAAERHPSASVWARPLVNPAMERARAANGSARSLTIPAEKALKEPAVAPDTKPIAISSPKVPAAADLASAPAGINAAAPRSAAGSKASVSKPAARTAAENGDIGGTTKKRHMSPGTDSRNGMKRGRQTADGVIAEPKPEDSRRSGARVAAAGSVAQQLTAAQAKGGGAKLYALVAAASGISTAEEEQLMGPKAEAAAAAASREKTPGKSSAEKKAAPLIRWPAAAEVLTKNAKQTPPAVIQWPVRTLGQLPKPDLSQRRSQSGLIGTPVAGHSLRDRSASARKQAKPWWVV